MAKTVTIPSYASWLHVLINGKLYTFKGGQTVSVPDEVAALLAANEQEAPAGERPVSEPLQNAGLYEDSDFIPVYTDKNGNLRIRKEDIPEPEIPEVPVAVCTFTYANSTWSADMTLEEIKAAKAAGKVVLGVYDGRTLINVDTGDSEETFMTAKIDQADDKLETVIIRYATAIYMSNPAYTLEATI